MGPAQEPKSGWNSWGGTTVNQTPSFADLMARVRGGDAASAAEIVRQYETELRVIARVRLRDPRLRRVVDTLDICQSVLANFFVRATAGQFDLDSPEQLVKLLAQMVRNKVTDRARRETAERRDVGRLADFSGDMRQLPTGDHSPSQIASAQELADRFQARLTADEREIMKLRQAGSTWEEIARQRGASPEALRKSFSRAVDAAAGAVGLDATAH